MLVQLAHSVAEANGLDNPSAAAIASTALIIQEIQSFIEDEDPRSTFDPSSLILFPPQPQAPLPPIDSVKQYLRRLVLAAQADAVDLSCSSILAGQGSESDDTGDIAVWLGPGDFSSPDLVLHALGLTEWAADGEIASTQFTGGSRLEKLVSEMEDKFSFRASASMTGVQTLQGQIELLTELQTRVQTLRHIPLVLLKPSISTVTLRGEFEQVKEIGETIRAEGVQSALRAARDSLGGDGSDLNPHVRREKRKRGTGDETAVVEEEEEAVVAGEDEMKIEFEGITSFVREFNRTHKSRLHLWRPTRGDDQSRTVLRYTCPDVLVAYISLDSRLMTESVATFGPRERKSPHSQSEFGVYRCLSQQIAKFLESDPTVAVQSVVDLLGAYETLFVERCVGCERVLSAEGHVPPVEIQDAPYGRWQLDAFAPPIDATSTPKVRLAVQALNKDNAILDTAVFGEFFYWSHSPSSSSKPKLHIDTSPSLRRNSATMTRRRGASNLTTPSPSTSPNRHRSTSSAKLQNQVHLHRRTKLESVMRPKGAKGDSHLQTPVLQLVTPLSSICENWTPSENAVGRRLVRFSKVQDGRRLVVSCEPIAAEDYRDADSVISCIYREESRTCYVTSVDIIFLLERLTNSDFPVEEKNRIRRNLEGLRPTTVSKHKHGFEDFFQRIMEFPDPKPRNIEKDLKVFEWSLLDQALDKILSKYTIDTSALPLDEPESSSSAEPSPSTGSDDAEYDHFQSHNEPFIVEAALTNPNPLHDEFTFLNAPDGGPPLCSPLDASHQSAAAQYHHLTHFADSIHSATQGPSGSGTGTGTVTSHWNEYSKGIDPMALEQYPPSAYDPGSSNVITPYPDSDFSAGPYDSFTSYHNPAW
ncbi:hypothetical protein H0H92_004224 [Tricholoma furcatifolium]|nr:hypothetical protein H0H92_004224 [Tricholoma furcatifolium]